MDMMMGLIYGTAPQVSGGGGAIVVTPLGANVINASFAGVSPWVAGSSVPLGTGDVYVFVFNSGSNTAAPTVGGVTATLVGTSTGGNTTVWKAAGVNTPTGNVSIPIVSGNFNVMGANWFLVTNATAAPTVVSNSKMGGNSTSPMVISGTIPASGVGLVFLWMDSFGTSANRNPMTWTSCVTSGNTTLEAVSLTGNGQALAGNYSTTAGAVTINATGTNSIFSINCDMMLVTVGP